MSGAESQLTIVIRRWMKSEFRNFFLVQMKHEPSSDQMVIHGAVIIALRK